MVGGRGGVERGKTGSGLTAHRLSSGLISRLRRQDRSTSTGTYNFQLTMFKVIFDINGAKVRICKKSASSLIEKIRETWYFEIFQSLQHSKW